MADYKTSSHNIYLTTSYMPTGKLNLSGTFGYNKSKTDLATVVMPDITDRLNGDLSNLDFSFDHMQEYSNLDFELLTVALGGEYALSPGVILTADIEYADLTDNTGYVYGVESGSLLFVRTGVRLSF
jgi:hypothetical protein